MARWASRVVKATQAASPAGQLEKAIKIYKYGIMTGMIARPCVSNK